MLLDKPFANLDEGHARVVMQVRQWLETKHGMQIVLLTKEQDLSFELKLKHMMHLPPYGKSRFQCLLAFEPI